MGALNRLTQLFSRFPGIGPRQAKRFVYFLLSQNKEFTEDFLNLIKQLKEEMGICVSCFRFFTSTKNSKGLCNICVDKNRVNFVMMVVGRDIDLENIEKTGSFNGMYFVLGGTVPILESEPDKKIRSKELFNTVKKRAEQGLLKEVIVALNANPEGENTADFVKKMLDPLVKKHGISLSALGRGLSTGTELEYSDNETLKNALKNRHALK